MIPCIFRWLFPPPLTPIDRRELLTLSLDTIRRFSAVLVHDGGRLVRSKAISDLGRTETQVAIEFEFPPNYADWNIEGFRVHDHNRGLLAEIPTCWRLPKYALFHATATFYSIYGPKPEGYGPHILLPFPDSVPLERGGGLPTRHGVPLERIFPS